MYKFKIQVIETRVKVVELCASSADEALFLAEDLGDGEFDKNDVIGIVNSVEIADCDPDCSCEDEENEGDDCDLYDDCDGCPDYCEVCGSCAQECDFVPNKGSRRDCKHRCSACGACTIDD